MRRGLEDDVRITSFVRSIAPGEHLNPESNDNGMVYHIISREGGNRFIRYKDIAQIKDGGYYDPEAPRIIKKTRRKKVTKRIKIKRKS